MNRCGWCRDGGMMECYHDREWGIPIHDDRRQFEYLLLEAMQCGLSWSLMLKKRETFRACFADFDFAVVAGFQEADIQRILDTPGMIRSRRKVEAIVNNARCFLKIREEFGSFDSYLWDFTEGKTQVYPAHHQGHWVASNALSDAVSRDLRKRGFKFLGSVTVYSHLQACGMVNDHEPDCWMYQKLIQENPCVFLDTL